MYDSITQEMRAATLVVDALLGTGMRIGARKALEWIREINTGFLMRGCLLSMCLPG